MCEAIAGWRADWRFITLGRWEQGEERKKFGMRPLFNLWPGASAAGPWLEEVEPDSEEERQQGSYDVRTRPKRHGAAQASAGDWRLELRPPGSDLVD
jgi:hypothetical protein